MLYCIGMPAVYHKASPITQKVMMKLMSWLWVKVTTLDRTITIVRALIDPASSGSFINDHLAQFLWLPHSNKNAVVEGVGETGMHMWWLVWLQVSGIKDDTVKIEVEAFVLKKITKDLPLQPIPLALNKDHLPDLKLADLEFRTPACIGLLLGAEVFTSVLLDGRQTRPQCMLTANNTCF